MADTRVTTRPRSQALPWALAGALAISTAGLGWLAFGPQDHGDPVAASVTAFARQNKLTVFSAQLSTVVSSEDSRFFGLLESRQVAVIPARVDYAVDFSGVEAGDFRWDEEAGRLAVELPDVAVGRPNLDEARAQYLQEGVLITREAAARLNRDNTLVAEQLAAEQASDPVLLQLARNAARDAVRQNLTAILDAAGHPGARVEVRFAGEPAIPAPASG